MANRSTLWNGSPSPLSRPAHLLAEYFYDFAIISRVSDDDVIALSFLDLTIDLIHTRPHRIAKNIQLQHIVRSRHNGLVISRLTKNKAINQGVTTDRYSQRLSA